MAASWRTFWAIVGSLDFLLGGIAMEPVQGVVRKDGIQFHFPRHHDSGLSQEVTADAGPKLEGPRSCQAGSRGLPT